jgi:hypothetical protein
MAYTPVAGTILPAGAGQQLTVTFTPTDTATYTSATATVPITVNKATPIVTWATPASIVSGTALSGTQLNATANAAGSFAYTPVSGTVLPTGAGQTLSVAFTPTDAANYKTAAASVLITVTAATPTGAHNAARANSYDDVWQDGAAGWVENAKAILAGGTGQTPGLVLWIGDSLTRDPALGDWAQRGAGKTAADQAITDWMHAGLSPQGPNSIDGFALATPYFCSARSFTVGDGLGAWDFMGTAMPADTNPTTARSKLTDCVTYPNALNLTTMLAALPKAQFAIPEVNLEGSNPGVFTDLERMVDQMIANHIVPIILTYTYRQDAAFNTMVDQYNASLVRYAETKKLPLIDLNREMLARLPFDQWAGRFLSSDGVHYTRGTTQFPSGSDPYAGGDPATHTTGSALTFNGYGLKGWLGVQKMKEIKQLVIDGVTPPPPPPPALTISSAAASNITLSSAIITWTTNVASSSQVDYGTTTAYGLFAANAAAVTAHRISLTGLSPTTTYHYRIVSQDGTGVSASTGDLVLTTPSAPDTTPPTVTSTTPATNAAGVSTATTVKATFSEAMTATTVTTASFVLRNPAGATVGGTIGYNATTRVATLTPSQLLAVSTTYTATISGVKDSAGNALAAAKVWSFTTAAAPPPSISIWSNAARPAAIATTDGSAVELGMKFRSEVNGTVRGVRFYKGTTTTGAHTGSLWSSTGTRLATATFTGETASGWQTVTFATPVAITANTTYVVSYHTNVGNYAYTSQQFATAGVDTPPLHALSSGVSGGNGVYIYGPRAFPTQTFKATNYWVDVVFVPQ